MRGLELRRASAAAVFAVVSGAFTGCSSGSPEEPTLPGPPPQGSIAVSIAPAAVNVTVGQAATTAVTVARSGGFDGAVALAIEGAPAGITGAFAPTSIGSGSASSTLTIAAAATTAPGTHSATVRVTGQGVTAATALLTISVQAAPALALALNPASLTLAPAATGTAAIQITRTNLPGAVALSVSGMPNGVTASIAPASAAANDATLTVNVGTTAAAGSYTLTVTGQAQGSTTGSATLELRVPVATFGWAQVSAGDSHTCGVSTSGVAYCWGQGFNGQRGDGTQVNEQNIPARVIGNHTWALISAGHQHTCGLTISGEAYCWGWAVNGRLGEGTTSGNRLVPTAVAGDFRWSTVSAGLQSSCGVTVDGDGYCWGIGALLGDGGAGAQDSPTPRLIAGGRKWRSIVVGYLHACGITTAGDGYCWGVRFSGNLGDGIDAGGTVTIPVGILGTHSWARLAPEERLHTCGLTTSGAAYCWGTFALGALGIGPPGTVPKDPVLTPTAVAGGHTWRTVSTGHTHSCGVTTAGAAYCWGEETGGQLGNGPSTVADQFVPSLVVGGATWASIDAGPLHTCGVTTTGRAYCWGPNQFGKIGAGPVGTVQHAPLEVTPPP